MGHRDSRRDGKPPWFLFASTASLLTVLTYMVAFWHLDWAERLGRQGSLVFVAAVCWEVFELWDDYVDLRKRGLPSRFLFVLFGLFLPGYVLAFIAASYGYRFEDGSLLQGLGDSSYIPNNPAIT